MDKRIKADAGKKQPGHIKRDFRYLKVPLLFCFAVISLTLLSFYAAEKNYLFFFELFTAKIITSLTHFFGMQALQDNTIIYLSNALWAL